MEKESPKELIEPQNLVEDITLNFITKVIDRNENQPYTWETLYQPSIQYQYEGEARSFKRYIEHKIEKNGKITLLDIALYKPKLMITSSILRLLGVCFQLAVPISMYYFIYWMQNDKRGGQGNLGVGIKLYTLVILENLIVCYLKNRGDLFKFRVLCFAYSNIGGYFIREISDLEPAVKRYINFGEISPILTNDIERVAEAMISIVDLTYLPIHLLAMQLLLFTELYWVGFTVPVTMIIIISFQLVFAFIFVTHEDIRKKVIDKRTKLIDQILIGIKSIKFNAWEGLMKKKCRDFRTQELKSRKAGMVAFGNMVALNLIYPLIITLAALALYNVFYQQIDLAKAYVVFLYITQITSPMIFLNLALGFVISGQISLERINKIVVLNYEERRRRNQNLRTITLNELDLDSGRSSREADDGGMKSPNFDVAHSFLQDHGEQPEDEVVIGLDENTAVRILEGDFSWEFERIREKKEKYEKKKVGPGFGAGDDDEREPSNKNHNVEGTEMKLVRIDLDRMKESEEEGDENPKEPLLFKNLNIEFKKGKFYGIVGSVGAGKSSLFSAILGQMNKISGVLQRQGSIALISQQDFISNDSLKNNILFGKHYEENWYNKVLDICQLRPDLEILIDGDLTEIGGGGVNLSGGQKQRISIARAVYAKSEVYLVDDCFSALDAYVGKAVLEQVFLGELKGKTIIMNTHQIHFLDRMDQVIYMDNGKVVSKGHLSKIKKSKKFQNYLAHRVWESEQDSSAKKIFNQKSEDVPPGNKEVPPGTENALKTGSKPPSVQMNRAPTAPKLIKEEVLQTGIVDFKTIKKYLNEGRFLDLFLTLLFFLLAIGGTFFLQWFIGQWGQGPDKWTSFAISASFYMTFYTTYTLTLVITAFVYVLSYIFLSNFLVGASKNMFEKLISNILRRPMSFFNTTSSGEIINRCTNDIERIDSKIPESCQICIPQVIALVIGCLCVLIVNPFLIFFVVLVAVVIFWYMKRYLRCSSDLKRLGLASLSPIIYTSSELFNGSLEIKHFSYRQQMFKKLVQKHDILVNTKLHDAYAEFWISLRGSFVFLGLIAVVGVAFFLSKIMSFEVCGDKATLIFIIISLITQIDNLSALATTLSRGISTFSCVERVQEYIENEALEAPLHTRIDRMVKDFSKGDIEIKSINVRYRKELPLVLKDLRFNVKQNEKIGIVGRTGSGKSTLLLSLMRIIEIDRDDETGEPRGEIMVDGVDISSLGLNFIRKNLVVIPQDPYLLEGTLRHNVDPISEYSDREVTLALDKVEFWSTVKRNTASQASNGRSSSQEYTGAAREPVDAKITGVGLTTTQNNYNRQRDNFSSSQQNDYETPKDLEIHIERNGENLSQGQRQLICIARALIQQPKILLMDEATSSLDHRTNDIIQKVVKYYLNDTTVLTIAHRLMTIIQYDKLIVLKNGQKIEEGAPIELIDKKGYFYSLVAEGEDDFVERMKYLATHRDKDVESIHAF